jgi:hypothetical protein
MKIFTVFFALLSLVLLLIGSYNALTAVERSQIDVLVLAFTSLYISVMLNGFVSFKEKKDGETTRG